MSTDDSIFMAGSESLGDLAGWLGETLGLERMEDPDLNDGVYLFRGRARTVGGDLHILVEPNVYGEAHPDPDDVSAIDHYAGVVDVRLAGQKNEELQEREARALFDELSARQPDVAMILSHNMALLTAAYLPGAGVRSFPRDTTLDADDIDVWRLWVVRPGHSG